MYNLLLQLHSLLRWLVVLSLAWALLVTIKGYLGQRPFNRRDNSIRHWTATIAHLQLIVGIILYTQSPIVNYYFKTGDTDGEPFFFSIIHLSLMLLSITIITIGSAMAKRQPTDHQKFRVILISYGIALLLIFLAIPWPFSPLAHRPYIRPL